MFNGMNGLEILNSWPRYESGESVGFGDHVSRCGQDFEVNVIALYRDGSFSLNFWAYSKDERVRRPAVLAANGEPLEVGQTVWVESNGDGPYVIDRIRDFDGAVDCHYESNVNEHLHIRPDLLTHQRPVLDADGVPIREGDTVWDENGDELVIGAFEDGGHTVICRYADVGDGIPVHGMWSPSQLTHERPDSWECIEEDAGCTATKYNERRGTIFTTKQQVARDLVRRCRALAERERGE